MAQDRYHFSSPAIHTEPFGDAGGEGMGCELQAFRPACLFLEINGRRTKVVRTWLGLGGRRRWTGEGGALIVQIGGGV